MYNSMFREHLRYNLMTTGYILYANLHVETYDLCVIPP